MEEINLVKRFVKKDGSQRISFYCDEYAENPRDTTDEPLHCEDWASRYSLMNKHERETKSENARELVEYLRKRYGDDVKFMSYSFGYYGEVTFSHDVSDESDGICWLIKDEFLKYSGHKEEYWNGKGLEEIEWLIHEIEAWTEGRVYRYVLEKCIKSKVHKEYINSGMEDEDYELEEWETTASCVGYYGHIEDMQVFMFEDAGLDIKEFVEQ